MSNDVPTRGSELNSEASSLGVTDVYYILFRRKWFILIGLLLGFGAAGVLWKFKAPLYQTTAKLMVSYVRDPQSMASLGSGAVRAPIAGGGNVLASEGEILTSLDVARDVAEAVGPCRIVRTNKNKPSNDCSDAAFVIVKNLKVEISSQIDVITLRFQHPDADISFAVLTEVIESYLKKHHQVHSDIGASADSLKQQRSQMQASLTNVQTELKSLKSGVGVFSIEEFKKASAAEESRLRVELFTTEEELEERRARLKEMQRAEGRRPSETNGATSSVPLVSGPPPPAKVREYAVAVAYLEKLQQGEWDLLRTYTPSNEVVKANRVQIDQARVTKAALEKQCPALLHGSVSSTGAVAGTGPGVGVGPDQIYQPAQISGLEAKLNSISNHLVEVRSKAREVEEVEARVLKLQKDRDLLDKQMGAIDLALQQRQFDLVLGSAPNIQKVQAPSPPARDFMGLYKKMGMAVMGGLGMGIGLAFLTELVLDRTLKRPKDVEGLLPVPLLLSIPSLRLGSKRLRVGNGTGSHALTRAAGEDGRAKAQGPPEPECAFKPFHEALRDRLVTYFEVRNMKHMPKLISVTSCNPGAGVSSVAAGLAASLSETGEGKVLLVDMAGGPGTAHAFFHGKAACGLEEALQEDSRPNALVSGNLYAVSGSIEASQNQKLDRIIPRQFGSFMPKLKASDYEYIIFDMPPVGQTSVTAKVARFMDMVLMVVEADKTGREVATRAHALLAESRGTVATVLNKRRRYVPAWLLQEFE